jgi:small subunit ribosomal protein S8
MVMTDPVADMLTRVRNAISAKHKAVSMPSSNLKVAISGILKEEGYIDDFKVTQKPRNKSELALTLRLGSTGEFVLSGLEKVSKPGCRVYADKDSIPSVLGGLGTAIISTSRGIMSGQDASKRRLGGEVLCKVW